LENKSGRLMEVTKVLGEENVNMSAFSMTENADFGILRLIVNDPERAKEVLNQHGFAVSLTDVICLECNNKPGTLADDLALLSKNNIFIDYMYAFALGEKAHVVLRTENPSLCADILLKNNKKLLSPEELYIS